MKRILIYGDSIFLAGLAAILRDAGDFEVGQISPDDNLADLAPDAVLVDLRAGEAENILAILRTCPHLPVIGVDNQRDSFVVFTTHVHVARTVQEALQILAPSPGANDECPPRRGVKLTERR